MGPPSGLLLSRLPYFSDRFRSLFLLDTTSGCVWHAVQDQETKRTAFIELEVQNLRWGFISEQLRMNRIDSATELTPEQKGDASLCRAWPRRGAKFLHSSQ